MDVIKLLFGQLLIRVRNRDVVPASPLKDNIFIHIQFLNHRTNHLCIWMAALDDLTHVNDLCVITQH